MRTYLDCYPCLLRQALTATRMAGGGDADQRHVVHQVLDQLGTVPDDATPPVIVDRVHRLVRDHLGVHDPYAAAKAESTAAALQLHPWLVDLVTASDDPLDTAVRIAVAGNAIDYGVSDALPDLAATVGRVLDAPWAVDDLGALRRAIDDAEHVLVLADNAGETVFDRVLVDVLDKPVTYAVKGGPVLNDATRDDAAAAGLTECATVVDTGSDAPGTTPALCSPDFRELLAGAPLVIAKGQANYETLSAAGPRVFCLLQAKCPVIARDLGVPVGSIVVRRSSTAEVAAA